MRPEAKIFAVIVAGRVNLAKESPKNLKKAVVTSKRLWRHPSSADSDHIFGRFQELQAKKIHFILDSNFFIVILRPWDTLSVKGNVNKQLLVYSSVENGLEYAMHEFYKYLPLTVLYFSSTLL